MSIHKSVYIKFIIYMFVYVHMHKRKIPAQTYNIFILFVLKKINILIYMSIIEKNRILEKHRGVKEVENGNFQPRRNRKTNIFDASCIFLWLSIIWNVGNNWCDFETHQVCLLFLSLYISLGDNLFGCPSSYAVWCPQNLDKKKRRKITFYLSRIIVSDQYDQSVSFSFFFYIQSLAGD